MVPPGSDPYDLLGLFSPFLPVLCMHVWYSQKNVHEQPLPWLWVLIPHAAYPIEKECLFSFICLCSNCCFSFVLFDLNHGPNQPGV